MSEMIEKFQFVYVWLCKIQSILDFKQWKEEEYPQYYTKLGLGRVGLISCVLGIILGIHVTVAIVLLLYQYNLISITTTSSSSSIQSSTTSTSDDEDDTTTITLTLSFILLQWCCYVICLCIFHLLEFFISSIYNPLVVTCTFHDLPAGCSDPDSTVECERGQHNVLIASVYVVVLFLASVIGFIATYLVYRTMKVQIQRNRRYKFSSSSTTAILTSSTRGINNNNNTTTHNQETTDQIRDLRKNR